MRSTWQEIRTLHEETTRGAKEGLAFKYFSRPLASVILYFIKDGRITPNQVTILSLLVGVTGTVVQMTILSWGGLVLGAALFMAAHVLDALDGQLARHRKAGSVIGMHFDFFIDEVKAYLMYVALTVRLYAQTVAAAPSTGRLPFLEQTALASPTWLTDRLSAAFEWPPLWILLLGFLGLLALAVGLSCTQLQKRPEWRDAFPKGPAGAATPASPLHRLVGLVERFGHLVVDYPSYIVPLCLINRVDVYLLLYTLVVTAYAARALAGISLRLWRINPY